MLNEEAQGIYVAEESLEKRTEFLHKTYQHLGLAIAAFIVVEAVLFKIPGIEGLIQTMVGSSISWLVVLGIYMGVSRLAEGWARNASSLSTQYLGLAVFVIAEAIVFLPLLWIAAYFTDPTVIPTAAVITGVTFAGLTGTVMITRKDFSFLRSILSVGGFVALGFIIASAIFGFTLGTLFAAVMVVFAAGAILYETSKVMLHYRRDQYVAASLGLFAAVALLFWYVLRLVMASRR